MKKILISVRPKWCEKICHVIGKEEAGKPIYEKRIEVRKSAPKEVPFKAYIYMTKKKPYMLTFAGNGKMRLHNGMVIGEFICDKVDTYNFHEGLVAFNSMGLPSGFYGSYLIFADDYKSMCLSYDEVKNYGKGKTLYGWHISDLKIYDKPKELSEFYYCCKEMKANEPRAGKYVSLSCYACRHNALKRTEDYSEYNNMLGYICKRNITRPPQSWCYVEEPALRTGK